MVMELLFKRLVAYLIDCLVVLLYAGILALVSLQIHHAMDNALTNTNPFIGQLVGFVSLTIPAFLYFFLTERSAKRATIGKRIMKLKIDGDGSIFLRNFLKLLPWEIAHTGVYWLFYYSNQNAEPPIWVWILLILPQLMVLVYATSILVYKGESSLYDKIANTKVLPF